MISVVATAGHVDHGKSTLIEALTGTHPDRLAEEKARGMTIDLGFAWTTLPSGREVGFVDVPGHQRFLHNMLAGVGSIQAVLFVVDATEGWMPQSQEHAVILNLLGVGAGVVAITKTDLVEPQWLELVAEEVARRLRGTSLEGLPILPVSAVTGAGLEELRRALDEQLARLGPAPDLGRPRLWIDRAFTLKGAGTVVTGTLTGGRLAVDQEVEIWPGGLRARVRSLQTHRRPVREAVPGSRTAANLTGVDVDRVGRGMALLAPGQWRPARTPAVLLRWSPQAPAPLNGSARLTLYAGTAEVEAVARLLEQPSLPPGGTALAQLVLARPLPLQWGDRLILRQPGRQLTVGGAEVLDPLCEPLATRRLLRRLSGPERRAAATLLGTARPAAEPARLRARAGGDLPRALVATLEDRGALRQEELPHHLAAPAAQLEAALNALVASGAAVRLGGWVLAQGAWERLRQALRGYLATYHREHPLASGVSRETARSALGVDGRLFDAVLAALAQRGEVEVRETALCLPGHRPSFSPTAVQQARRLVERLQASGFAPPTVAELVQEGFDEELIGALTQQGCLVRISRDWVFTAEQVERVRREAARLFQEHGSVDPARLRDALGSSRRFVIPLLEYLDHSGFTRRVGDRRVLAAAEPPRAQDGRPQEPLRPSGSTGAP